MKWFYKDEAWAYIKVAVILLSALVIAWVVR